MPEVITRLELGDVAGHDFHGNQWTGGHSDIKETIPKTWKVTTGDSGDSKITTHNGHEYIVQKGAGLDRITQIMQHEGYLAPVPGKPNFFYGQEVVAHNGPIDVNGTIAGPSEVHGPNEVEIQLPDGSIANYPRTSVDDKYDYYGKMAAQEEREENGADGHALTEEQRDNVRTFGTEVYDSGYEVSTALNDFSSNSPNMEEPVMLRAALVDAVGADRDAEVLQDNGDGYTDWLENYLPEDEDTRFYEGGIPENVKPSEEMQNAANMIVDRYQSDDPKLDSTVTLYRGTHMSAEEGETVGVNVLSSWTTSPQIAGRFGPVVAADIPLRQIVGEGSIGEDELLVFSPDQEVEVHPVAEAAKTPLFDTSDEDEYDLNSDPTAYK